MKTVLSIFLLLAGLSTQAQQIVVNSNKISIDPASSLYPLVKTGTNPKAPASQVTTKETICWLETGTGFYSTDPAIQYQITTNQSHPPLLLVTNLYDTGKGGVNRVRPSRTKSSPARLLTDLDSYAGVQPVEGTDEVRLQSNVKSIVPGDTMIVAITYRVAKADTIPKKYKLYFFYNNNSAFIKLNGGELVRPGLPFVRLHHQEIPFQPAESELSDELANLVNFKDHLAFKVDVDTSKRYERTIFITLVPNEELDYSSSGSMYAVLKDEGGEVVAADILQDLPFARAHDPNYLQQSPSCLLLPKKRMPFTYRVHFQNTGEGPAKEVKLVIQLPRGMDWATFKLDAANFAGEDYDTSRLIIQKDLVNNRMTVEYISRNDHFLMGRTVPTPATNELTMGDLRFTIDATTAVSDSMPAFADIYFLSLYPLGNRDYELPVRTNIASTLYRECCVGCTDPVIPNPAPACCYRISGLCWWWWMLIIAVVTIIIIINARRRRKKETSNNPR